MSLILAPSSVFICHIYETAGVMMMDGAFVQRVEHSPVTVTMERPAREGEAARAEPASFESLFLEHWPRVYSVLVRLVGDPAEAEDLALETFWRLYQRPPEGRGSLGGWLYRVALNLGYNALRAARRRLTYEESAGRDALEHDHAPTPAEAAERAEQRRQVRAVLAEMPARDAQLLLLRHSGFSYKEIAVALGLAPTSIGALLARAEQEFEKRFATLEAGSPFGREDP